MNIEIERMTRMPIEQQKIEMVERKGLGHPDSLADCMAEEVSRALSKEYVRRYGAILHHNTDKLEIVAGESKSVFGGGEIIRPIFVLLSGRATTHLGDDEIPVHEIGINAASNYMRKVLPYLAENGVEFDSKIGMGSSDLRDVFKRKDGVPGANDTSFGVCFAPLSETERLVFGVEQLLNSEQYKKQRPELGTDIKVMGLRQNHHITITVAGAFVSRFVHDMTHYKRIKEEIIEDVTNYLKEHAQRDVSVFFNTGDSEDSAYLTLSGTSAEAGDDGCVGRGNRVNGLITPNREMSLEAAAGKNPFNHVGKLYNIAAKELAEKIHEATQKEVYVKILSQIGRPINDPLMVSVEIEGEDGNNSNIKNIIEEEINNITKMKDRIINGGINVC
jgi:S-adenosylmethionine synthetase